MQRNQSEITEFIFLGFGKLHELQLFLFSVFLVLYVSTMAANILTILLIITEQHLHTPMYFFLGNLSCLEMFYSSTIQPKMLASLFTKDEAISLTACLTQLYFCGSLAGTECYLLSVMSYDRYLAICKPLHYATRMSSQMCVQLAACSWINGFVFSFLMLGVMLQLTYCGPNEIDDYYCDSLALTKLACSDRSLAEVVTLFLASAFSLPPFLLTITSYILIITTVFRIPSTTGRKKAFSTCSSHLIVVSTFYGAIMIVYMLPKTDKLSDLNKVLSLSYTVLPPFANPLIYTLRNKEVKEALGKMLRRVLLS
ncbi:olfactory receptor 11A1-like [Sphaerodactylus townsendi]|uniref:olfactory receptor 11A1-like n=1 Tax=Sphaerodactylus townsendi TaxID=933632 RepID=UPI00202691A1|nr:olfactory receptor 11A1-like [Sphaerodactylus townsendi]